MKVLKLNSEIFGWLNLYPTDRFKGKMKHLPILLSVVNMVIEVFAFISSVMVFRHYFEEGGIEKCLQAFFQTVVYFSAIYTWTAAYINREKMVNIFKKFHETYDTSNSFNIYCLKHIHVLPNSKNIIINTIISFCLSAEDPRLICYLEKSNRSGNVASSWLVIKMILIFSVNLIVMAVLNVLSSYSEYGQINEDVLYAPYLFAWVIHEFGFIILIFQFFFYALSK